jgi:hypothetical protein
MCLTLFDLKGLKQNTEVVNCVKSNKLLGAMKDREFSLTVLVAFVDRIMGEKVT